MIRAEPGYNELVATFVRIGLLSFGGPAGQIALMHREIVEDRGWLGEQDFLRALNFCHLLPGPEAQQLATFIGWRLHGVKGGLTAGLLFILPGAAVMFALSLLYAYAADLGWFAALFLGIKAAVLAIVVQALVRIAGRALDRPARRTVALMAFIALFFFDLPFPLVILSALMLGTAFSHAFAGPGPCAPPDAPAESARAWPQTAKAIAGFGFAWALPLAAVWLFFGPHHILLDVGLFFSQLAIVTFGGAYAVLAYMAQEAVQSFGWLQPGEMADGLGLAETTPGPLILVTQFVGFLAGFRAPDPLTPLAMASLAALLTLWVTFVPCFLWIFALAPWIDRLNRITRLQAGLAAVTAAVVGVIANLTLWFALHILFVHVDQSRIGAIRLYQPDMGSFDPGAAIIALGAGVLLFRYRIGILPVLGLALPAGLVVRAFVYPGG